MFPTRRRHPLQTFRFWFVITGAAALTLAWRFDLFPVDIGPPSTGTKRSESFTEVDLPDPPDWDEPIRRPDETAPPFSAASEMDTIGSLEAGELTLSSPPPIVSPDPDEADTVPSPQDEPFDEQRDTFATGRARADQSPLRDTRTSESPAMEIVPAAAISDPSVERRQSRVETADQSLPANTIDFSEIDRLIASHAPVDHVEAHRLLSQKYWQRPEQRTQLRQRIEALAQRIYFQPQPHYLPAHEIQPGDMLQTIARQYDVSWQYLARLNRVDPQHIRAGQRIKVIKGPFSAIIDLSDFELTVHAHGYFVTRYRVGIGKDGSTPIGTFTVKNKQVDPTYYGPDGVIDHDDPANPLGERWIDIGNSYGIHGTVDADSIGSSQSRGCIRMHNDDVAAVYDLLTVGSEVTIRE